MSEIEAASAPELSVVIVTDSYDAIRKVLRYFRSQGDPARFEIVIAALGGAVLSPEAPEVLGFPHLRIVPVEATINLGRAEVQAFHASTAPFVVFAESCACPLPGFVDAIAVACRSERWVVVGPSLVNANPGSATSWAATWINYMLWIDNDERGPVAMLPGHNSAYQRRAMLALGDELDDVMQSLTALQVELRARGGELCLEPTARCEILNVSRPGWYLIDQFGKGRQYATFRRRRWSLARRLLYTLGSPLIPVIRLVRILAELRRRGHLHEVWHGPRLVMLMAGLVMGALGEFVGYVVGGPTAPEFYERNLYRPRYLRPEDTRRDADESTWPR